MKNSQKIVIDKYLNFFAASREQSCTINMFLVLLQEYNNEHLHEQDEVLFFLDGSGYVDMRNKQDHWVRVPIKKGILYVFPAGLYHRLRLETVCIDIIVFRCSR